MKYRIDGDTLHITYGKNDEFWRFFNGVYKTWNGFGRIIKDYTKQSGISVPINSLELVSKIVEAYSQTDLPEVLPRSPFKRVMRRMIGKKPIYSDEFDTVVIGFKPDEESGFRGYTHTVTGYRDRMKERAEKAGRRAIAEKGLESDSIQSD